MYSKPLKPHEAALRAYHEGDTSATLNVRTDLGEDEDLSVKDFASKSSHMLSQQSYPWSGSAPHDGQRVGIWSDELGMVT